MKRVIVPFFISHQGCPHRCVFCDQRTISGASGRLPSREEILTTIDEWRNSARLDSVEVAFYGGTFTALSPEDQNTLLAPLSLLVKSGIVSSIRVSTRPDAINDEISAMLFDSGVRLVELGVQSMDDRVLTCAGRGHSAADTESAFKVLRRAGIQVGAQIMPGLPGDSADTSIETLRRLLPLRPDLLRIYPAVVLKGTELARMYAAGEFEPLSIDDAVSICKVMLQMAAVAGIPVIRAGLPGDGLISSGNLVAGPYHPAFRQLADGERWYDLLSLLCRDLEGDGELELHVAASRVSDVIGHKRVNLRRIETKYRVRFNRVITDVSLSGDDIVIKGSHARVKSNIVRQLMYDNSMNASKEIA